MKVLVSGDEYCYKYNGKYYLTDRVALFAERYLVVFDELKFAFRTKAVEFKDLPNDAKELTIPNLEIIEIPFFQGPFQMFKSFLGLINSANKATEKVDCAILRLPSATAFLVWHYVKKNNIPYATELVFDCQDAFKSEKNYIFKSIWKIMHLLQKKACIDAKGVSCVTRRYLQKHYQASHGAFTSHYSSIELKPDFFYHKRSFPKNRTFTIIHVASQVSYGGWKGHIELIKTLSLVRHKGYDVQIRFVGGDYMNGVAKLSSLAKELNVQNHIKFTGQLNTFQVREELINADIAVLPTKAEGLPRVVIEAMAVGLPCITSPVSGNPELIDAHWLVNYDDVHELANKIIELISHQKIYEDQSRINYERSHDYSCEILNQRRSQFYLDLKKATY